MPHISSMPYQLQSCRGNDSWRVAKNYRSDGEVKGWGGGKWMVGGLGGEGTLGEELLKRRKVR
jgi:hypothetical protein